MNKQNNTNNQKVGKKEQIEQINYEEQCSRLTEFLCTFQDKSMEEHPRFG